MSRYDIDQIVGQIYKNLRPFGIEMQKIVNTPAIQRIGQISRQIQTVVKDPASQQFIHNLSVWAKQQEEIAPHMEQILDEMKNNGNYSEALKTIRYRQLLRLIINNEKIEDKNLLNLINQEVFQKPILTYFEKIDLGPHFKKRKSLIEEAFQLYKHEFYAGCLTLLLSQFEGIITDYLIFKNVLKKDVRNGKTKFYDVAKLANGVKENKAEVSGLAAKIVLAKNINASFMRLESFNFDNDENIKFHNERNDILHGSNIANFNAERCFVVFIWIDSILGSIYTEEVLPSKQTSAKTTN
ncbi:hypothetical protein [Acinetobacter calcoaceticus]|uniref:hypothetical protein n=1 Tax=Acinetobacter calcoaceticus TaxID=471 RepID=UPI00300AD7CD